MNKGVRVKGGCDALVALVCCGDFRGKNEV